MLRKEEKKGRKNQRETKGKAGEKRRNEREILLAEKQEGKQMKSLKKLRRKE